VPLRPRGADRPGRDMAGEDHVVYEETQWSAVEVAGGALVCAAIWGWAAVRLATALRDDQGFASSVPLFFAGAVCAVLGTASGRRRRLRLRARSLTCQSAPVALAHAWDVGAIVACRPISYTSSWAGRPSFVSLDGRRMTMLPHGPADGGVMLKMRDGETVLVGSKDPEGLCQALVSLGVTLDPEARIGV
jgi:hypothetical protein